MKRFYTLFIFLFVVVHVSLKAQVAINTDGSSPDASAMLDVKSVSGGLLIPRMSTAQRDAITTPATGLIVYVTDDSSFYYYTASQWTQIKSTLTGWIVNGNRLYPDTLSNVGVGTTTPNARFEVATIVQQGTYGTDQCTGGTASASEFYGAGYEADKAFDNNTATRWDNNNTLPAWLQYDFGSSVQKRVAKYSLYYTNPSSDFSHSPDSWQLEASNNGTTWTVLDSRTGEGWTSDGIKEYTFSNLTPYRYYRLNISDNLGTIDNYVSVFEMEMMEEDLTNNPTLFVNNNKVGVGTSSPLAALDVNGSFRLNDGNQANGLILVSDASGIASWASGDSVNAGGWTVNGNYVFNATDSIGIGTTTPTAALDVSGRIVQTGTGFSVFLGEEAGANDDFTDNYNVFIGYLSGNTNTSGFTNTSVGTKSLTSNTTGSSNAAFGYYTLNTNTTGTSNSAFGLYSLQYNVDGTSNTAMGSGSLLSNSSGSNNTAVGSNSLQHNSTGNLNTASGNYALGYNTTGIQNTASGDNSLVGNTTGSYNTATGAYALYFNSGGNRNIALGYYAGNNITTGSNNIVIGANTNVPLATGSYQLNIGNTLYGDLANGYIGLGTTTPTATLDVAGSLKFVDGKQAAGLILVSDASGNANWASGDTVSAGGWSVNGNYVFNTTDSIGIGTAIPTAKLDVNGRIAQTGTGQSVFLGEGAGANDDLTNNVNVFIGYQAGLANIGSAGNTAVGYMSLSTHNTLSTWGGNTALGYRTLYLNTSGTANTALGSSALRSNTTADNNTAVGSNALYSTTGGGSNTAVGSGSLQNNTSGHWNTASGYSSLFANTIGKYNAAFGFQALDMNTEGHYNVAVGMRALHDNTTASNNVAIGTEALYSTNTFSNTAIGHRALYFSTGSNNTAIGSSAGDNITTGSNNIIIGAYADAPSATGSYQLNIGNTIYGDLANGFVGLGTTIPAATLDVAGTIRYVDGKQAAGLILVSDASGNAGWADGDTVIISGWTKNGNYVFTTTDSVGIGTSTPIATLDVNGRIAQTGTGRSVFIGEGAGVNDDLTNNDNTFIGYKSGNLSTTGNNNTAIGYASLLNNTVGAHNTAVGFSALTSNISGTFNTAAGYVSLISNSIGAFNTANGYGSLSGNTTASHNIAIGTRALSSQSYSNGGVAWNSFNVAVGDSALYNNQPSSSTDGILNVAIGAGSLAGNTTGYRNTANGHHAGYSNTTGFKNTALGAQAMKSNITGDRNTAIGNNAMSSNTYGGTNTAVGSGSFTVGSSWNNSSAFGYNAEPNASNTIVLGNGSVSTIGGNVGWSIISDKRVKNRVQEDVKGLDFIMNLRPVTYYLDKDKIDELIGVTDESDYPEKYEIETIKQSGFLAQEVETAAKQSGYDFSGVKKPKGDRNYYGLSYSEFVVPLVKGMQEQQQIIEQQQQSIEAMKTEIELLKKLVSRD